MPKLQDEKTTFPSLLIHTNRLLCLPYQTIAYPKELFKQFVFYFLINGIIIFIGRDRYLLEEITAILRNLTI